MRKHIQSVLILLAAFALFAGCTNQDYPDIDYSSTHQNAADRLDAGQCVNTYKDAEHHISEHIDCNEPANKGETQHVYSAPFKGNLAPQIEDSYEGYFGVIDGDCHEWYVSNDGTQHFAGDMDYIEIRATPGTPLTVNVSRVPGHKTDPILTLRNRDGVDLLFGGQPVSGISQISFFMPGNTAYIAVEEGRNYDAGGLTNCRDFGFNGGKKYHYLLTVNQADFNMMHAIAGQEGLKKGEASELVKESLSISGSVQYYSVLLAQDIDRISVELTPNIVSSDDMPVITPLERSDNETLGYDWAIAGSSELKKRWESETSKVTKFPMQGETLELYATPKGNLNEVIFAVSDLNGHYGYPYSIKVSAD